MKFSELSSSDHVHCDRKLESVLLQILAELFYFFNLLFRVESTAKGLQEMEERIGDRLTEMDKTLKQLKSLLIKRK